MTDKQEIKQAMEEVIRERFQLPHNEHRVDHEWVRMEREKYRIKQERWEKWKISAGGALIVAAVGAVLAGFTWVFTHSSELMQLISKGSHHGN